MRSRVDRARRLCLVLALATTSTMAPTAETFIGAAAPILREAVKNYLSKMWLGRWMSLFGTTPEVCVVLWNKIDPRRTMVGVGQAPEPKHLLWALIFLRIYDTDEVNSRLVGGVDEKTFRKWAHPFVEAISFLEYPVVRSVYLIL